VQPPLPPLLPGGSHEPVLTAGFTIEGELSSFDEQAFQTALADELSVSPSDVTLVVQAGSILVTAEVIMPTLAKAYDAEDALMTASSDALSTALGVNVVGVAEASVSEKTFAAPSPPPPTPSPPTPPKSSDDGGLSGGAIAGIVIGSLVGVALIGGFIYYFGVYQPAEAGAIAVSMKPQAAGSEAV